MEYRYATIDYPYPRAGAQYQSTDLSGINNFGQISGTYDATGAPPVAFTDSQGHFTALPATADAAYSGGINDRNQVVLTERTASDESAFIYNEGRLSPVASPAGSGVAAIVAGQGINDRGDVVGMYGVGFSGFLNSQGRASTVDVPGAEGTLPFGINNAGQIVGWYYPASGGTHGFLDTGGHFETIDIAGAAATEPFGINDFGDIVGTYIEDGRLHGFLDTNGHITSIDVPGADNTVLFGINDVGEIIGSYVDSHTNGHGFLAASDALIGLAEKVDTLRDLLPPATQDKIAKALGGGTGPKQQSLLPTMPGILVTHEIAPAYPAATH